MKGSWVIPVAMIAAVGWAVWEARDWYITTKLFPWVIGFPLLGLLVLQLLVELFGRSRASSDQVSAYTREERRRGLGVIGWLLAFIAAVWLLGFNFGGPLVTLGYLRLSAGEKWTLALGLAISVAIMLWVMAEFLYIPFPQGFLSKAMAV